MQKWQIFSSFCHLQHHYLSGLNMLPALLGEKYIKGIGLQRYVNCDNGETEVIFAHM